MTSDPPDPGRSEEMIEKARRRLLEYEVPKPLMNELFHDERLTHKCTQS